MTTVAALADWLDRYEQAWRNNDAAQIRALFTDDAVYRWHPWEEAADGADGSEEIAEACSPTIQTTGRSSASRWRSTASWAWPAA